MNIGMILDNEFTGDMRVENEVISLSKAGYKVFVLCFNHGNKKAHEDFHGAHIIRIPLSKFRKNKMKGLVNTFIDPYTWFWAKKIVPFVKKYKIDILHVHDLYMLGAAYKANKRLAKSLPIVSDLHENFAVAIKYYKYANVFPGKYIISIPKWERTEVKWVNKADAVITVIDEAVDRYQKLGVPKEKITLVANYVNADEFLNKDHNTDILSKFEGQFVMTYIGGFDTHRGLECVIKALPRISQDIPTIKLVLVGAGNNEMDLRTLAKELNVEQYVSFEGFQPPAKLPDYNAISDICLIPHLKTEHTDNTIPHKLFQYMLLEKPVLASDCKPLKRILENTKSGLTFQSNNENDFAEKVITLYQQPDLRAEMGKNGAQAVKDTYNWDNTAANLIALYKRLETEI